jgi:hypothetical protein
LSQFIIKITKKKKKKKKKKSLRSGGSGACQSCRQDETEMGEVVIGVAGPHVRTAAQPEYSVPIFRPFSFYFLPAHAMALGRLAAFEG